MRQRFTRAAPLALAYALGLEADMAASGFSSICAFGSRFDDGCFTTEDHSLIQVLSQKFDLSVALLTGARDEDACIVLSDDRNSTGLWAWTLMKNVGHCRVSQGAHCFDFSSVHDAVCAIGDTLALEAEAGAFAMVQDRVARSDRALAAQTRRRAFALV